MTGCISQVWPGLSLDHLLIQYMMLQSVKKCDS